MDGDVVTVRSLTVVSREAAALARGQLEHGGSAALDEFTRKAVAIGMVALGMGEAGLDASGVQRTLDDWGAQLDTRSKATLDGLSTVMDRLETGEKEINAAAHAVLAGLPAQLQQVLGGEAGNIQGGVQQVVEQLRQALATHSVGMREMLTVDREGPLAAVRREILDGLNNTRQELAQELGVLRGLAEASRATTVAKRTSTRPAGDRWEEVAMDLAQSVVVGAGDIFEATGKQVASGGNGTTRVGDGVATVGRAVTGGQSTLRIVLEAKIRTRPLTAHGWNEALAKCMDQREAVAGIALVPDSRQVPGGMPFARVSDHCFVVALDDDLDAFSLVYTVVREIVALRAVNHGGSDNVDVQRARANVDLAVRALAQFDAVAKHATAASRSIASLLAAGKQANKNVTTALVAALAALGT